MLIIYKSVQSFILFQKWAFFTFKSEKNSEFGSLIQYFNCQQQFFQNKSTKGRHDIQHNDILENNK
jgi:hypothetical protein